MGKTYHSKTEFQRYIESTEAREEEIAEAAGIVKDNSLEYRRFTFGVTGRIPFEKFSRHPKGTRGKGLSKGLKSKIYKNRFDERDWQTDRLHRYKKAGTKQRRAIEKRELIENEED